MWVWARQLQGRLDDRGVGHVSPFVASDAAVAFAPVAGAMAEMSAMAELDELDELYEIAAMAGGARLDRLLVVADVSAGDVAVGAEVFVAVGGMVAAVAGAVVLWRVRVGPSLSAESVTVVAAARLHAVAAATDQLAGGAAAGEGASAALVGAGGAVATVAV